MKKYLFGYGSLVSKDDIERDLKRDPGEIKEVRLNGWIRDWGVSIHNETADRHYEFTEKPGLPKYVAILNIRRPEPNESPTNPNGVLYEVTDEDLARMDARERHYKRTNVTSSIEGVDGEVYAYVGLKKFLRNGEQNELVLPKSYLDLVEGAFMTLGPDSVAYFSSSTLNPGVEIEPTVHKLTK